MEMAFYPHAKAFLPARTGFRLSSVEGFSGLGDWLVGLAMKSRRVIRSSLGVGVECSSIFG